MHAEIISIGDEITSGQTLDTNSQWLSQRLEELGVPVRRHTTVGDELAPCAEVFRQAIARDGIVWVRRTADKLGLESTLRSLYRLRKVARNQ